MKRAYHVVVAGAGVVGLAMSSLLAKLPARAGLHITLIDAIEPARWQLADPVGLRVSAIATGSMKLLTDLGVRSVLDQRACPYRDMRVWDAGSDAMAADALHFAAAEMALPELGFIVEDALLRAALYEALPATRVTCRFGAGITAVDASQHPLCLSLADGNELEADLVIAADGANSAVRDLAGIDVEGWHYDQAALVTHARPASPHQYTAWQRFLPTGPLALLPLSDGRVSIVWSAAPEQVQALLDADDAALSARLTEASAGVLGTLSVAAPRASFPLQAQHARHYVQRGLALVGDAAHTVHPLAGQGANLGLADAAALAQVIANALDNSEHPADLPVLRRYERERRGANTAMLRFVDALNRLFSAGTGLAEVRQGGMRLFNKSGLVKRRVMQVALGL